MVSPSVQGYPAGLGAVKKTGSRPVATPRSAGRPPFLWVPRLPRPGGGSDAGSRRSRRTSRSFRDRASAGPAPRKLARAFGVTPVVPPHRPRRAPWPSARRFSRRRHEVERVFRRVTALRRVFPRFAKRAVLFLGFLPLALLVDALRSCEHALI